VCRGGASEESPAGQTLRSGWSEKGARPLYVWIAQVQRRARRTRLTAPLRAAPGPIVLPQRCHPIPLSELTWAAILKIRWGGVAPGKPTRLVVSLRRSEPCIKSSSASKSPPLT